MCAAVTRINNELRKDILAKPIAGYAVSPVNDYEW